MSLPKVTPQMLDALGQNGYIGAIVPQSNEQLQLLGFQDYTSYILNQIASAPLATQDGLIAQGNSNITTSVMSYGINIFTSVTNSNFATKLPQPVTGKSVVVVNKGSAPLYVYPSNVGGEINNLGVNNPYIIPQDGTAYTFYCIENPQPGQWSIVNQNAIQQISPGQEIIVNHTSGVQTFVSGWKDLASGSFGAAYSGGLVLNKPTSGTGPISDYFVTGYTAQNPTRNAVAVKWQTNGPLTTNPGGINLVGVQLSFSVCGLNGPTSSFTLSSQALINLRLFSQFPSGYSFVNGNATTATVTPNSGGPVWSGNIGDNSAVDVYIPLTNPEPFGYDGANANRYFIFSVRIPAGNPSGVYKFVPYVEFI